MTTQDLDSLKVAFSRVGALVTEIAIRCQLTPRSNAPQIFQLREALLNLHRTAHLYSLLLESVPEGTTTHSPTLRLLFPPLPSAHPTPTRIKEVSQALQEIEATLQPLTQVLSPSLTPFLSSNQVSETGDTPLHVEKAHSVLHEQSLALVSAFRSFWLFYLQQAFEERRASNSTLPSTDPLDKIIIRIISEFQASPFSVDITQTNDISTFELVSLIQSPKGLSQLRRALAEEATRWSEKIRASHYQADPLLLFFQYLYCSSTVNWSATPKENPTAQHVQPHLAALQKALYRVIAFSKHPKYRVMLYGQIRSGKDTLLNALVGASVLPSTTTTCPCRVQHVPGQSEPKINVPAKPFTVIIEYLRSLQFHGRMREHESSQRNDSPEDGGFERLTKAWSRLHDEEKAYLSIIENPTYHLHLQAQGVAGTRELLSTLNILGSICQKMGIPFDIARLDWPIVTVEFLWLRDAEGSWEFLNVMGHSASHSRRDPRYQYLERAIEEGVTVVPVIHYTQQMLDTEWMEFPRMLLEAGVTPPCVIGSHLDKSRDGPERFIDAVARGFWPNSEYTPVPLGGSPKRETPPAPTPLGGGPKRENPHASIAGSTNRPDKDSPSLEVERQGPPLFLCNLSLGGSAAALLHRLEKMGGKPSHESLWSDENALEIEAIERIFGDRLATGVYNRQTFKGAMEGLKEELADTRVDIAFSNLLQLVPKFRKSLQTSLSRNVMMELQNITHKLDTWIGSTLQGDEAMNHADVVLHDLLLALHETLLQTNGAELCSIEEAKALLEQEHTQLSKEVRSSLRSAVASASLQMQLNLNPEEDVATLTPEQLLIFTETLGCHLQLALPDTLSTSRKRVELSLRGSVVALQQLIGHLPLLEHMALDMAGSEMDMIPIEPLPEAPTLDTLKKLSEPLGVRSSIAELFRECQKMSPFTKKRQNWWRQLLSFTWTIFPFIYRLPRGFRGSPIYHLNLSTIEVLYFDSMIQPWLSDNATVLLSKAVLELQLPRKKLQETESRLAAQLEDEKAHLTFLLSLISNLYAATVVMRSSV